MRRPHDQHRMHAHSLASYEQELPRFGTMKREILDVFKRCGQMTDREALTLYRQFAQDMNLVRPKITALLDDGFLVESDQRFDTLTKRVVRVCRAATQQEWQAKQKEQGDRL
jgi:uncharacterized membrane protein YccC